MADVNRTRTGCRAHDRGQLILVTGLLVAVTMVALVLLLNTAIYTENLASRGADQSGTEAIEYRATIVDGVGGLIDAENDREHAEWGDVEENVTSGIGTIDNLTARSYATGGTVVRINQSSSLTLTEGRLVRQANSTRQFLNDSGTSDDWTVANGVENVRNVRLTVDRGNLSPNEDDALTLYLNDSTRSWEAFVYQDGSNVTVATSVDGGSVSEVCSVEGSEVAIEFTRGTIAGASCNGLTWAEGLTDPYDVQYRNGANATGTYDMTVDASGSNPVDTGNVSNTPSGTVYHVPAVYSTTFQVSYRTATLTYRSEIRVAPGEPE